MEFSDYLKNMKPHTFHLLCIAVASTFAFTSPSHAADQTSTTPTTGSEVNNVQTPNTKDETVKIKKHRITKLNERLTTDEETLKKACRFESDIPMAPPAKEVALTFDDGPEPVQTEFILAVLKKHKVPATFFMIGEKVQAHPDLVKLVKESDYTLIANHSWSHPNFHEISPEEQAIEIQKSNTVSESFNTHKLFRYPYGNSSCESNQLLKSMDQKIVGWHVDSCDWAFDHKGSVDIKEALTCGVLSQNRKDYLEHVISSVHAHNGGIVLMHEIHPNTLKNLDQIITRLLAEGYVFKSLADDDFQKFLR
ncbi:polysaccharide deacetylase family protein [Undibacterium jejuense]|uniref:Polysaccharide deacetylase family protein n=2 Tax=Undibacterium jejuense TaxID=1344949 RepID=A0A923HAR6_9BURK|nr:polysaccharide deacetylase family protein [Undibacterium jejuense]